MFILLTRCILIDVPIQIDIIGMVHYVFKGVTGLYSSGSSLLAKVPV